MQRKVEDFLYEQESYKIRGACFKVYNTLSGGIKEKIVERALVSELRSSGMRVDSQVRVDILYRNEKIGIYIPDLVVDNKIMIELKSKPYITKEDKKQFWGYLKGSSYQLGFLVNFGHRSITIKRFVYTNKLSA